MERIDTVFIEEPEEQPTCSYCIYCQALDALSALDEENNGYCEKKQTLIDQTNSICEEYIEDYEQ